MKRTLLTLMAVPLIAFAFTRSASADDCLIRLEKLRVHLTNESRDEPFLWVFGLIIDTKSIVARRHVTFIGNPGHGNVTSASLRRGAEVDQHQYRTD